MKIFFQNIKTYDLQGNILSLTRYGITSKTADENEYGIVNDIRNKPKGPTIIETQNENSLWPTYGSQTYLPSGSFTDNTFDRNGNTVFDDARETSFAYNHLNLATKISNPLGALLTKYNALGNKVKETIISNNDTVVRYFNSGTIYESDNAGNMAMVYHSLPEGYFSNGRYFSVIHDYLGSVRMVIKANNNEVQEVNHYDPFGVEYGLSSNPFGVQLYKHQGMERLNVSGFSLHYHFARNADNLYGRWLTRDKLEEDDYWNGAHVWCGNNGVRYNVAVDPIIN
ncbi:MAG: hypothetical protein LBC89_00715 [Bacteroidales bacterium]|jgi:hypothetical protein|nr:hypothetical protein [Bacteroidales bacterium]